MSNKKIIKKIYKAIKKYDTIVIGRHVGPDPDCLSSQIALRDVILNTFPNKNVYAVGAPAAKFKFLGALDKTPQELPEKSLLILLDLPNADRADDIDYKKFAYSIKIDHHPFIEEFCDIEWIDDTASSTAQMIAEFIFNTKLLLSKEAAEKLFVGIVADTNRFLFSYTTPKTFKITSELIEKTHLDFTGLYENLYLRPLKEIKFQGYVATHMKVTNNGFAYIIIDEKLTKEYEVDLATARNMVNDFNYIDKVYSWAVFTYDEINKLYRGSIRSRGPVINKIAEEFNGGGHIFASGVRAESIEDISKMVGMLDYACQEYLKAQE